MMMARPGVWIVAVLLFLGFAVASAEVSDDDRKIVERLQASIASLDRETSRPEGERAVVRRLAREFAVDEARVATLRSRTLGYGEIATLLSFAKALSGGITDANVQKVLAMRQGPPVMGWGQMARASGVTLGPAASRVHKVAAGAHRLLERAQPEKKPAEKPDRPR